MKPGIDILKEVIQEALDKKRRKGMANKTGRPPQTRQTDKGKEKWCSKGKHYQPADLEHFYRDAKSKTGLSSWCRQCQRKSVSKTDVEPVETDKAPAADSRVLELDFSENELLYEDILVEAADQLRTPEMQAMWLASKALYKERNAI